MFAALLSLSSFPLIMQTALLFLGCISLWLGRRVGTCSFGSALACNGWRCRGWNGRRQERLTRVDLDSRAEWRRDIGQGVQVRRSSAREARETIEKMQHYPHVLGSCTGSPKSCNFSPLPYVSLRKIEQEQSGEENCATSHCATVVKRSISPT